MPSAVLYIGMPKSGKSTIMRAHVDALRRRDGESLFFICDHDDSWNLQGAEVFESIEQWWSYPRPCSVFRGVDSKEVARLAIDVGWSVYVDDECDGALEDWRDDNPVREIVKRGRHLRNRAGRVTAVTAMLATHRPANLPSDVIGLFERIYVGKLQSYNDADRIYREGWLKDAANPIQAREILQAKEPGDFSIWP